MHEQLEIWQMSIHTEEETQDVVPYQIGDLVQVKEITPDMEECMSPEDHYYLLGFSRKKGIVTDIKTGETLNIYVDIGGVIGVFYEQDLKLIG